jgi:hypothetical protein
MATTSRINIDKATVRQVFKVVARVTDEIRVKETLFVHWKPKRQLVIQPIANASEIYMPNMFKDSIALTQQRCQTSVDW